MLLSKYWPKDHIDHTDHTVGLRHVNVQFLIRFTSKLFCCEAICDLYLGNSATKLIGKSESKHLVVCIDLPVIEMYFVILGGTVHNSRGRQFDTFVLDHNKLETTLFDPGISCDNG